MTTKAKPSLGKWRGGSAGFFRWLADIGPMVPSARGGFEVYEPCERERREIAKALDGGYSTLIWCWPRRHGKTLISALIIVHRFLTAKTQNVAIVANSEKQTTDTAFRLVRTILQQTEYTANLIKSGAITIGLDKIEYEAAGSIIQGFSANPAALFGKKVNIAQVSEMHAAKSDAVYQALASCTIDSDDGLVLVDSTVGPRSSPLFALYQLAERGDDPSLFFSHVSYRDLEDAVANSPRWIDAKKLRSRAAQMLPAEFAMQHLNVWTSGVSALFPPAVIDRCRGSYRLDVGSITGGAACAIGAGLDRAFGFSLHGDATVATCIVKTMVGDDEHIYVLASDRIRFSSGAGIKGALTRYRRDFGMARAALENYNSQDIAAWCADQDFDHELVHPTAERQATAFTALYNAAAEGRLHVHPTFESLLSEMANFEYRIMPSGTNGAAVPRFEAAKGAHDDHVYSLAWSVYSLRELELNPYEISGIHCYGSGPAVAHCLLNGGDIVPPCAESCRSFQAAFSLYKSYRGRNEISALPLPDFLATKLKNVGAHTMPRH
jgi:hypothetical protein